MSKIHVLSKVLCYLGIASMTIMYLHMPVKFIILARFGFKDSHSLCILFGIILSLIAYEILRQFKFTKKFFLGTLSLN